MADVLRLMARLNQRAAKLPQADPVNIQKCRLWIFDSLRSRDLPFLNDRGSAGRLVDAQEEFSPRITSGVDAAAHPSGWES